MQGKHTAHCRTNKWPALACPYMPTPTPQLHMQGKHTIHCPTKIRTCPSLLICLHNGCRCKARAQYTSLQERLALACPYALRINAATVDNALFVSLSLGITPSQWLRCGVVLMQPVMREHVVYTDGALLNMQHQYTPPLTLCVQGSICCACGYRLTYLTRLSPVLAHHCADPLVPCAGTTLCPLCRPP